MAPWLSLWVCGGLRLIIHGWCGLWIWTQLPYPFYNPFCGLVFCNVRAEEEEEVSVADLLAAKTLFTKTPETEDFMN